MKKLCFSLCAALALLLGVRAAACAQELTVGGQAVGIVQGMSDSPIMQNGRLVGAITPVSVST